MQPSPSPAPVESKPLSVWLAGRIDWPGYAAMSERLAGEAAAGDRNPTLVLFELDPCITIGRGGSRTDVRLDDEELRSQRLSIRFTGRGGGAVVHGPGQVCLGLFARLADLGLTDTDAGGYLTRLQAALQATLGDLRCGGHSVPGCHGIFGRTGLLAVIGAAIRRGCVAHGGFLNVCPRVDLLHRITTLRLLPTAAGSRAVSMSSVEADVQRRVRLQEARTALLTRIAEAFGSPQPLIHAGFPFNAGALGPSRPEYANHVG